MNTPDPTCSPPLPSRQSARLRLVGVLVLALGLAAAALVYWMGTRTPMDDLADNPDTSQAYKNALRQTEMNFGKTGLLVDDLWTALNRPGTQALLITVGAVAVAAGCFYVARLLDRGNDRS